MYQFNFYVDINTIMEYYMGVVSEQKRRLKMAKEEQLKEIAKGVLQKNENTYYIVCRVTGERCYCNKPRLDKLASKYGGIDKIYDNYVSRNGKAELKASAPVVEKKKEEPLPPATILDENGKEVILDIGAEQKKFEIPSWMVGMSKTKRDMTDQEYQDAGTCWRPDIFFDNQKKNKNGKGSCDGCSFFATRCGVPDKNIAKPQTKELTDN